MEGATLKTEKLQTPPPETQQVPPSNIYPLPKNKKGAKKFEIVLLTVLIIGIILTTVGFLFKDEFPNLISKPTPTPAFLNSNLTPTPIINDLQDEIEYTIPEGWTKEIKGRFINLYSPDYRAGKLASTEKGISISLFKFKLSDAICPMPKGKSGKLDILEANEIIIDKIPATTQTFVYEEYSSINNCIKKDDFAYFINFAISSYNKEKYEGLIDHFLSTFKFTE